VQVAASGRPSRSGGRVRIVTALAAFAVLALTIALVSFAYYRSSTDSARRQGLDSLQAITRLKAQELSSWVKERYGDGEAITRDTDLGAHAAAVARGGSPDAFVHAEGPHLAAIGQAYGYAAIAVLDPEGGVLWHSGASAPLLGDQTRELVRRASVAASTQWSDLYLGPDGEPTLDFAAPLIASGASGHAPSYVVLLRVDPSRFLFPYIQTWPGDSRSAETLLVRRAGSRVVYLNELRFRRDAALRLSISLSSVNLPAARAIVRGGAGVVDGRDYRGVRVIAAYRAVPGTDWHLVAKVDQSELLAGSQSLFGTLLLMSLAVVLAAGLATVLVWRSRELKLERASAALERERLAVAERYRLLLHHANDIVLILDQELHVVDANEQAGRSYGYSRDELLRLEFMSLRCDDQPVSNAQRAEQMRRDGGVVASSVHLRRDGSTFPVQASIGSIESAGQRLYVCIVHDLTERQKLEDELRDLNLVLEQRVRDRTAELLATNDELEAFSYSVSHDLRAPLRHVSGFTDLLERRYGGDLDEQAHHYMESISRSAHAMGELIDDLLQFSRAGRTELKLAEVDMNEALREARESLDGSYAGRNVEWRVEQLPVVWGDKALLRQVWVNLLGNSVKFTRPRSEAEIAVQVQATDGEYEFTVRDNGVGFDMEYADKLFGVFQRLHRSDEFEGTGVGLANVRRIITRLGGRTWGEGVKDKGAVFCFTLPRRGGTSP
jgi:PAS domain S-box-containing protein